MPTANRGWSSVPSYYQTKELHAEKPFNMKVLFVLLIVAVAAMAHPERERRSLPLLAPGAAIISPHLGGAIVTAPGPAVFAGPAGTIVTAAHPWPHAVVAPAIWG